MGADDAKQAQGKANQGQVAKQQTMATNIKKKRGGTETVPIQIDGELASEILELRQQITLAEQFDRKENKPDTAPKLQNVLDELIAGSKDTEVVFVFKAVGRIIYDELVELPEHQPTDEQKKGGAQYNIDTFPAALVALSCVDPEISPEQATEIFSDSEWNGAELQKLFFGALKVNTETADIPLSKGGSETTASLLSNLLTQASTGSPTVSS